MNNWPEEIPIPDKIGSHFYYIADQPYCAVGHLHHLGVWNTDPECPQKLPLIAAGDKYFAVYKQLVKALFPVRFKAIRYEIGISCLESINDHLNTTDRTNVYLLTWAKLGYTEGMPKRILKLLDKPEVQAIKVKVK